MERTPTQLQLPTRLTRTKQGGKGAPAIQVSETYDIRHNQPILEHMAALLEELAGEAGR